MTQAHAASPDPLIERELLFGNPERTQGRISPDGTRISYIAPLEGVLNVWVAPADDLAAARAITRDTGRGIRMHAWAPDGRHVLYLQDTGGDENFLLHAVNLESGEARNLTPFPNTEAFACGVDIVGPSNLETLLESIPPYWQAMFDNLAQRVGDPRTEEGLALLRERSPLHQAQRIERPLLIAQGANDPRVKQAESDQIVDAMRENELPVTYVLYPDEGHGFARPQNSLAFFAITEAFLAQCLGGRHQPIGDALVGSSTEIREGADFVPGLIEALAGFEPEVTH